MLLTRPDSVRPEVEAFTPYTPGLSIDEIQERYGLNQVIKMASNENPLGASPLARAAIERHAAKAFRYPQGGNPRLVAALARHHGVDPARVVVGNGSDELIDLLIRTRAVPGRHNVAAFSPCFSIYALQSRFCGVELRQTRLKEDFAFDCNALLKLVDGETALVFVTTPDNPSGYSPPAAELKKLALALPAACLLVLDEAYMDFADDENAHSLLPELSAFPNIAIIRTFSKSFGLAGLRLGYALLPPRLADYLWRVRLPFSVNILAEEAGLAALSDSAFREESLRVVRQGRETLSRGLRGLGCQVWPSQANFIMFRPPAGSPAARDIFERLLRMGIIIRPLASYGLPDLLRVSMGTAEENRRFLDACTELLHAG
ncbi:MAG: histidinol-phosphate transaminase [Deltaproteobacteria bacterium]|jgi:histidinol-phosphate aminotransferase|nr:histidinol-phosphate transaminase [Deltaproteobacteria bacterium]